MKSIAALADKSAVLNFLETVLIEHDRIELRAVYPIQKDTPKRVDSGIFDRNHLEDFAESAVRLNAVAAVYVNLNPIEPNFQGSATNKIKERAKGLFGNNNALARKYILIDCDPIRPTNTSSTNEQLKLAKQFASKCATYLEERGWGSPILGMSGNGYHLLYKINLPNIPENTKLIENILDALGLKFNNEYIKIDKVVANPGRIFKVYGTVANKGPNALATPHRLAVIKSHPVTMPIVSEDQLRAELPLGYLGQTPSYIKPEPVFTLGAYDVDIEKWVHILDIPFEKITKEDGLVQYRLDYCPFNKEHGKGDSSISKAADGKFGFKCFHNSCMNMNWHSVRALIESKNSSIDNILQKNTEWPEPQKLPGELRPVLPLNPNWLPSSLHAGCVDIAERLNCPLDYVAIPAIVGAGTALGNTVGILPKEHDESWVVHAGFWGGIVGSPGSMKTPALLASLKPLQHLEEDAALQYKQAYVQYQIDKAQFDKAMANFKSGKSTAFPLEPAKPTKARFIVNDVTYQALGEILANNPRGVLALADELSGLLQTLDTPGQEAARGFYLSGWGGQGSYTFDRITRESVNLARYQLAVFGGFQPDRIKTYVRFSQSGSSKNDGLLQRFQLLVWPDLPELVDLIDRQANKEALMEMHQAIVSLKFLNTKPIYGASMNTTGVQLLHFEKPAQQLFNTWYQENEKMLRNGTLDSSEHGHFAKYRSLVPGLTLLFHLLDGHQGPVCEGCLHTALLFAKYLKSHARRVYASVHGLDSTPTRSLADKLLSHKLSDGFTQRSILHKGWANLSTKDKVYLAVNALVERD